MRQTSTGLIRIFGLSSEGFNRFFQRFYPKEGFPLELGFLSRIIPVHGSGRRVNACEKKKNAIGETRVMNHLGSTFSRDASAWIQTHLSGTGLS
jgi:hypothetical protein